MVKALAMIDRIKPRACRARVQREFSASRMAGEYHQLYGKLISAHQRASVEA
jgi:hypothetical protein